MQTLFRDGGFSMYFVLAFGALSLGWAAEYAFRGPKKPTSSFYAMMLATLFATCSGVASDLGTTFKTVSGMPNLSHDDRFQMLLEGAGESMAPAIMGFSFLALSAFLLAWGAVRTRPIDSSARA